MNLEPVLRLFYILPSAYKPLTFSDFYCDSIHKKIKEPYQGKMIPAKAYTAIFVTGNLHCLLGVGVLITACVGLGTTPSDNIYNLIGIVVSLSILMVGCIGILTGWRKFAHKNIHRLKPAYAVSSILSASVLCGLGYWAYTGILTDYPWKIYIDGESFVSQDFIVACVALSILSLECTLSIVTACICYWWSFETPRSSMVIQEPANEILSSVSAGIPYQLPPNTTIPHQLPPHNTTSYQLLPNALSMCELKSNNAISYLLQPNTTNPCQLPPNSTTMYHLPPNARSPYTLQYNSTTPYQLQYNSSIPYQIPHNSTDLSQLPPNSIIPHPLQPNSTTSYQLAPNTTFPQSVPSNNITSFQLPPNSIISHQLPPNSTSSYQQPPNSTISHELSTNGITSYQLPSITTIPCQFRTNYNPTTQSGNESIC